MPVLVKNTEVGPLVFSDVKANISLEWAGAGDPNGEDLQQVPDEMVTQNTQFIKLVNRGLLVIEEAPEAVREAMERQQSSYEARRNAESTKASASIDQQANNDLITKPCVGPNNRGQGECGEFVPVREKDSDEKPPLCPRHQNLAGQFILTETDDFNNETGKAVKKWERMGLGPRDRQSQ